MSYVNILKLICLTPAQVVWSPGAPFGGGLERQGSEVEDVS